MRERETSLIPKVKPPMIVTVHKELPSNVIMTQVRTFLTEGRTITLPVKGRSMRPFLEGGRDAVILAPIDQPLAVKDVVLAEVASEVYMIHRIIKIEGDTIIMQGDGNIGKTEQLDRKQVIGIVIGFQRKGQTTVDWVSEPKWLVYSNLWLWLTPIRRLLLAFHRRIWLRYFSHDYFLHPLSE